MNTSSCNSVDATLDRQSAKLVWVPMRPFRGKPQILSDTGALKYFKGAVYAPHTVQSSRLDPHARERYPQLAKEAEELSLSSGGSGIPGRPSSSCSMTRTAMELEERIMEKAHTPYPRQRRPVRGRASSDPGQKHRQVSFMKLLCMRSPTGEASRSLRLGKPGSMWTSLSEEIRPQGDLEPSKLSEEEPHRNHSYPRLQVGFYGLISACNLDIRKMTARIDEDSLLKRLYLLMTSRSSTGASTGSSPYPKHAPGCRASSYPRRIELIRTASTWTSSTGGEVRTISARRAGAKVFAVIEAVSRQGPCAVPRSVRTARPGP